MDDIGVSRADSVTNNKWKANLKMQILHDFSWTIANEFLPKDWSA